MVSLNIHHNISIIFKYIGKDLGHAFDIPRPLQENTFFAHISLKSTDVRVNFGDQPFKTTPVCLSKSNEYNQGIYIFRMALFQSVVHRKNVSLNLKLKILVVMQQQNNVHQMHH